MLDVSEQGDVHPLTMQPRHDHNFRQRGQRAFTVNRAADGDANWKRCRVR